MFPDPVFHDVQQNTEEWDLLRAARITSSKLSVVMANFGKAFGDPAKKYAVDIAVAQLTGKAPKSGYSNDHMECGHEEEPLARMAYEEQHFCNVSNGGFFAIGDDLGCSPDGLLSEDGVIEIKSAIPSIHYERIRKNTFDSAYKWQLIGNMVLPKRDWIDFVSYCSDFPLDSQLFTVRLHVEDYQEEAKMIAERLAEFRALIDQIKNDIRAAA